MNCTQSRTSEQNKALAAWLKQKRIDAGLTMRDLAAKLGTPHSTIGKIENCDRRVDVVELLSLCDALNVDPVAAVHVMTGVQVKGLIYQKFNGDLYRKDTKTGAFVFISKIPEGLTLCDAVNWYFQSQK